MAYLLTLIEKYKTMNIQIESFHLKNLFESEEIEVITTSGVDSEGRTYTDDTHRNVFHTIYAIEHLGYDPLSKEMSDYLNNLGGVFFYGLDEIRGDLFFRVLRDAIDPELARCCKMGVVK